MSEIKTNMITLNNGNSIPQVGLGTWQSKPGEVGEAVKTAIDDGYRHIDCAYVYQNEEEIGAAIQQKIREGKVKRDDLFIVSKLWCTFHSAALVRKGFDRTLKALKTPYLDLFLIHAPYGFEEGTEELFPMGENNMMRCSEVDFVETWIEMEKLVKDGLVRSIGISNFNAAQTQRILDVCSIKPVTNQVECHPYLNNEKLLRFSALKGIPLTAYAPLGSPGKPWPSPDRANLLTDDVIVTIAARHSKSPAQILIRFAIQRGVIVIPKSTSPKRIEENLDVHDFLLSNSDMAELMALNVEGGGRRAFAFENTKNSKFFPFNDDF